MSSENSNRSQLFREIINLSLTQDWKSAKKEWDLVDIHREEEPETCLCGHFPIVELCELKNRMNGNLATVGNVCVKKFLELPSNLIFSGLGRVAKDHSKALNEAAIWHAFKKGWINTWEKDFCLNTRLKRNLTERQKETREEINRRVLTRTKNTYGRRHT